MPSQREWDKRIEKAIARIMKNPTWSVIAIELRDMAQADRADAKRAILALVRYIPIEKSLAQRQKEDDQ